MNRRRAVIFTAIECEIDAVIEHISNVSEVEHEKGSVYDRGEFHGKHDWEITVFQAGPGLENTAVEAERLIALAKPDVAIFCGVAGGIKDVSIGDVVIGTKVYGYESGKEGEGVFYPRPDLFHASNRLVSRSRAQAKKHNKNSGAKFKVYVEPIAAGSKVVASNRAETAKFIRNQYGDALAVEMEGHGLMLSAHSNEVPAIVVRGISDLLDKKGETDAVGSQELAAKNAAEVLFDIILNFNVPLKQDIRHIDYPEISSVLGSLHRHIERSFSPDVVLTMSGPGSVAACQLMALNSRDIPVIMAVTFPSSSLNTCPEFTGVKQFGPLADKSNWVKVANEKWIVYIPDVLFEYPLGSKVIIFDDRVNSGVTQREVKIILESHGFVVKRGAMFAPPELEGEMDWIGRVISGEYSMPWGTQDGRYSPKSQ